MCINRGPLRAVIFSIFIPPGCPLSSFERLSLSGRGLTPLNTVFAIFAIFSDRTFLLTVLSTWITNLSKFKNEEWRNRINEYRYSPSYTSSSRKRHSKINGSCGVGCFIWSAHRKFIINSNFLHQWMWGNVHCRFLGWWHPCWARTEKLWRFQRFLYYYHLRNLVNMLPMNTWMQAVL